MHWFDLPWWERVLAGVAYISVYEVLGWFIDKVASLKKVEK